MKTTLGLTTVLMLISVSALSAQQSPTDEVAGIQDDAERVIAAMDSVVALATPQLQEAMQQLATRLSDITSQVANDPDLRAAAFRAAGGLVNVAQVMVEEHADEVQDTLRVLADRIAGLSDKVIVPDEVR